MSDWHRGTLIAFDTETTGTDVENDRIVTAAIITIDPLSGAVHTDQWLADPGIDVPAEATAVHGISTEMARAGGRPAAEVVSEIAGALNIAWQAMYPVIAYNASFDLTLLDRELRRHTGEGLVEHGTVIDPFVIDKHYDRYRKGSRKLAITAACYGVDLSEEDAHGAAADALAAARVAWKQANMYRELAGMELPELHGRQAEWYAEQAASFEAYLRRVKLREEGVEASRAVHVSREWPIRPVAADVQCCSLHRAAGCCDPDDCGPCCSACPTCPTTNRAVTT
ncbi:exonuclease domain-containing protein [Amycolatopsis thermoflava]|uniref:exonuclease domain-containing protein n=1 Tax=Amycolatopsis thermoflava TaxID=84480 RepID=UPI0004102E5A|nr:exonuclease domain-containing protein [Amycolatopsis thermoflava]